MFLSYPETASPVSERGTSLSQNGLLNQSREVPLTLPGLIAWYDFSDRCTLYQDSSYTPARVDGDPVGMVLDKSSNQHHVFQSDPLKKFILTTTALPGRVALLANLSTYALNSTKSFNDYEGSRYYFIVNYTTSISTSFGTVLLLTIENINPYVIPSTFAMNINIRTPSGSVTESRPPLKTPTRPNKLYFFTNLSKFYPVYTHKEFYNFNYYGTRSNLPNSFGLRNNTPAKLPNQKLTFLPTTSGYTVFCEIIFGSAELSDSIVNKVYNYLAAKWGSIVETTV